MIDFSANSLCPCQSGRSHADCCRRYQASESADYLQAPSPEALMRSRYTAFVLGLSDYLSATWHPTTRPASLEDSSEVDWKSLCIEHSAQHGEEGTVTFEARFKDASQWHALKETSRFVCEQGHWFYVDGDANWSSLTVGRNDACPCGSGKKAKKCCL